MLPVTYIPDVCAMIVNISVTELILPWYQLPICQMVCYDCKYWAIPENIHTPPMDDIGNPVRNAQLSMTGNPQISPKFCKF